LGILEQFLYALQPASLDAKVLATDMAYDRPTLHIFLNFAYINLFFSAVSVSIIHVEASLRFAKPVLIYINIRPIINSGYFKTVALSQSLF